MGPVPFTEYGKVIATEIRQRLDLDHFHSFCTIEGTRIDVKAAGMIIHEAGQNLTNLELDISRMSASELERTSTAGGWSRLNLEICSRLESLTFRIDVDLHTPSNMGPLLCRALASLLAISPPTLRKVTITVKVIASEKSSSMEPLDLKLVSDFPRVDAVLSRLDAFPHLETVQVAVDFDEQIGGREKWLTGISGLFPRLKENGLLTVTEQTSTGGGGFRAIDVMKLEHRN
ncbi:hypothetical protein BD414DRAFT_279565 [Trametes punicea]|nr:hypothetical protein BD414DRAFT_279565 [Trametes punicea]